MQEQRGEEVNVPVVFFLNQIISSLLSLFFQFFRIEDCDPLPMGHWVITEAPGL